MNEKVYKTLSHSGALSLTLGIVILVTSVAAGILLLVNGARLLGEKSKMVI